CVEKPDGEQNVGIISSQGAQSYGRIGGIANVAVAVSVQSCGASYDDKPCNQIGEEAAGNDVEAGQFVFAAGYTFFDDGGLQVELHPRCDSCSDKSDHHEQIAITSKCRQAGRLHCGQQCLSPCRLG